MQEKNGNQSTIKLRRIEIGGLVGMRRQSTPARWALRLVAIMPEFSVQPDVVSC